LSELEVKKNPTTITVSDF